MRPHGMRSRWVKIRPWFYTERSRQDRQNELRQWLLAALHEYPDDPELERLLKSVPANLPL
jgi:hypothetical protein